jgi:hypothetical protein
MAQARMSIGSAAPCIKENEMKVFVSTAMFFLCIYTSNVAQALDFSREPPTAAVTDKTISVAGRSVKLPDGEWFYLSHFKGQIRQEGNSNIPWHSGYFVKTIGSQFHLGLILALPEGSRVVPSWNDEPCKFEGLVFKSELNATVLFPECLIVNRRAGHLQGELRPFLRPVKDWVEKKQIEPIGAVYEIFYAQYSATGFGRISLFIPVGKFKDDESAIEWAKSLPQRFRALFENRAKDAELPNLP